MDVVYKYYCTIQDGMLVGRPYDTSMDKKYPGHPCGERNGRSELTEERVLFIRAHTEITQTELAKMFNVSQAVVSLAQRGKTWKYLLSTANSLDHTQE